MFPTYKLSRQNTQSENMSDIAFEKATGRGRTVNRASGNAEGIVRRVLKKMCYEKFRRVHKATSVPESLFDVFL